jgi:hypothetical protein
VVEQEVTMLIKAIELLKKEVGRVEALSKILVQQGLPLRGASRAREVVRLSIILGLLEKMGDEF